MQKLRVAPRPWIGFAIWAGYIIVVFSLQALSGVPYDELSASTSNIIRFGIIPLLVGSALLIITASLLGWWRPALIEDRRLTKKWLWIFPILMVLALIVIAFGVNWTAIPADFLLAALALGVIVGFAEEFMARGLLVTALRGRYSEVWVWFTSSALFGIMHAFNALLGAPLGLSLIQAGLAFVSGSVFYLLRRLSGALWPAMVLHGLWDFTQFAAGLATA